MQYFIFCQSQRSHPQLYAQFSCREGSGRRFENGQNGFSDCLRHCLSTVHWLPCLTCVAHFCDDFFHRHYPHVQEGIQISEEFCRKVLRMSHHHVLRRNSVGAFFVPLSCSCGAMAARGCPGSRRVSVPRREQLRRVARWAASDESSSWSGAGSGGYSTIFNRLV